MINTAPARWNEILSALHTQLSAALDCDVSYGVPVDGTKFDAYVLLGGVSGEDDGAAGSFSQNYHDMAGADSLRDEDGDITCQVWAFDGDHAAVRATVDRAFGILDDIAYVLRSSIDLGDARTLRAEIARGSVTLGPDQQGAFACITFTLSYRSLI